MKTVVKFLAVVAGLLTAISCEDDRIYPSPQKRVSSELSELSVVVPVPFNSEFETTFTRILKDSLSIDDPGAENFDVYFWGMAPWQPFYILEMNGIGENPVIGRFTLYLYSTWKPGDGEGLTRAYITDDNGEILNINIKDNKFDFTHDYPYDQTICSKTFKVIEGTGKFKGCKGSGLVTFLAETSDSVMTLQWDGTLELVITR
jgi:hypothetical protein